jgi:hypothetical protein
MVKKFRISSEFYFKFLKFFSNKILIETVS